MIGDMIQPATDMLHATAGRDIEAFQRIRGRREDMGLWED
jgi:hypothetical protein